MDKNTSIVNDTKDKDANMVLTETIHVGNANNRVIFENVTLTSQFLRNYSELEIFKNVQPEDIEDVTNQYEAFLGIEFETDSIKRVRVKLDGVREHVYVLPLIEHKSYVDFDVAMQLFRYMAVIWYDYAKKQNAITPSASRQKKFRYPMIIPVVYYEGKERWTADMNFQSRIAHAEKMREYIPEFYYQVVQIRDYTNDELKEKHDEMALIMLLNKIQSAEDYKAFLESSKEFVESVYEKTTEDIQRIVQRIMWSLFMKMNVSVDEAQSLMKLLEDGSGMGYLFENMEKIDIQAERRKTKEAEERLESMKKYYESVKQDAEAAKQDAEAAKQDAEAAKQDAEAAKQDAEAAKQDAEAAKQTIEAKFEKVAERMIIRFKEKGLSKEDAKIELIDILNLDSKDASKKIETYWK